MNTAIRAGVTLATVVCLAGPAGAQAPASMGTEEFGLSPKHLAPGFRQRLNCVDLLREHRDERILVRCRLNETTHLPDGCLQNESRRKNSFVGSSPCLGGISCLLCMTAQKAALSRAD